MTVKIDVIIPTLGTRGRELERAIASVHGQVGASATPLVVVNGNRFDPELAAALEQRRDLRLHRVARPSVSNARWEGRRQVTAPFFAFLDDDDELLPEAMKVRLAGFSDSSVDVVVTNGYSDSVKGHEILFENFDEDPEDPVLALLRNPWLASAGGLYRTETIGLNDLADLPDYLEITKLAFRLALSHKVERRNVPTFIKYEDAREKASSSGRYREETPRVLASMEKMTARKDLKALLRARRSSALHKCSEAAWREGKLMEAWRYHLHSLSIGGWRYLSYSRRLLE